MNYQVLAEELVREEYAQFDDQAAADALNARTVAMRRNVPLRTINILARSEGITLALRTVRYSTEAPAQLRALAEEALSLLDDSTLAEIDMDDPASAALIGALRVSGLMTDEQAAMFSALADGWMSRGEQLGLGVVRAHHVASAKAGGC